MIRILAACALAVLLAGCFGSKDDPRLEIRASHVWSMPPDGARIPAPRCVWAGDDGETLALDTLGRVLRFDGDGTVTHIWWMPAVDVGRPEGICRLQDGRIVVADTHYHRVVYFDSEGSVLKIFGSKGAGPGQFIYPVGLTQDPDGDLYVVEYGSNDRVQKFDAEGRFIKTFGAFGTGETDFQRPSGIAWHDGEVYIADAINNRVQVYSDEGVYARTLGVSPDAGFHFPYDLSVHDGALYVAEYGAGRVTRMSTEGAVLGRYGESGRGAGQFTTPWSLTVSAEGLIRVADTGNRRIVELTL